MKYSFDSCVRYSEIGEDRKLTLNAVINYFQDCSTFHSEEVGVGIDYLEENHTVWVLSAWQIVVKRYPSLCEKIKITTWPYAFRRFMGSRNFTMEDADGNVIAYANSIWTYLNTETGLPVNVSKEQQEAYRLEEKFPMDYASRKITFGKEYIKHDSFCVRPHHLDTNHHVNNGQYVAMACEYVPENFEIGQMRAEYKGQAVLGDMIIPMVHEEKGIYTVALCNEAGEPYAIVELKEKEE